MADFNSIPGDMPPKGHVVLVVEDEPMIRLALCTHLEDAGFEVREAANAADAIEVLQEPGCMVNLVFSDVRMPGEMDGVGLSRWIFENRPNIAVVLASGDMGKETAMKDLCGVEAMTKPYNFDAAATKIRDVMKKRRPPTA
jgi:DNA-binding NtrC family response regulator